MEEPLVSGLVDDMPAIEQPLETTLMFEHLWPLPEGRSAHVAVRFREASGAAGMLATSPSNGVWYGVASAAFLRGTETAFDVPFRDTPIEAGWLSADRELVFVCAPGDRANGFAVYAASVLQESSCGGKPDAQSRR